VGNDAKLRLAIRTVAVTTRVAVKSRVTRGDPELAIASAERGLALLDQIDQSLDEDASRPAREQLDAARRELDALANPREGETAAVSIGVDDSSLEEKVNVRPKLRP
jgi:hypothetical protein